MSADEQPATQAAGRLLRTEWDRTAAVVLVVAGGLVLVLGWFGLSDKALTAEQIPYLLSGGVGGIFLAALGATLWLSADLRDEWNKLDRIERLIEDDLRRRRDVEESATTPAPTDGGRVRAAETTGARPRRPRRRLEPLSPS